MTVLQVLTHLCMLCDLVIVHNSKCIVDPMYNKRNGVCEYERKEHFSTIAELNSPAELADHILISGLIIIRLPHSVALF